MGAIEDEVLVDLVRHRQDVVGTAERGDLRELLDTEHLAGRVVGCVEQDETGARTEGSRQLLGVERPVRRVKSDQARGGSGHGGAGGVRVVGRFEHHHFVARLAQGQQGGGDGLGCARGHQDLVVGRVLEPVPGGLVRHHGGTQLGHPLDRRILIAAGRHGLGRHPDEFGRTIGIGKPLP
jgi:hypothetical protein